ncbi:MAG: LON peptidase substrate-binding domain-containing protein [Dehalococcoidia bacterium]|nr:LON peptidase substrate-binding domain-containing protein [Dehalococcoidia bacterium]
MELPLFTLNTVLFPGAGLPLHIFEERYKQLVRACLDEGRPFGVLLIRRGNEVGEPAEPFDVGTTAHIESVEHLPEGRMNLACVGGQRFRLLEIVRREPYMAGRVELLPATAEDDGKALELAGDAGALFAEYLRLYLALSNQWARSVEMPGDPAALADFIASRLGVNLWTKQLLLEEISLRKRLALEVQILAESIREMTPRVEVARATRWHGFAVTN